MLSRRIKVGIIGFGLSGRVFHGPLLKAHSGFEVHRVVSGNPTAVSAMFPQAKVVPAVSDLLGDAEIDLVINCAPNRYHFEYSAASLKARKHVVVEKPFVNQVDEGRQLILLAEAANRRLTVFHNRRWDADFLSIQKLLAEGTLGLVEKFESHFDRFRLNLQPERWREQFQAGSGILFDLGSHLIDQALFLFGMPSEIAAKTERQRPGAVVDDYFHLTLKYGEMSVILQSTSLSDRAPRFEITGSKGRYVKFGLDPQESQARNGMAPSNLEWGEETGDRAGRITLNSGEIRPTPATRGNYLEFYNLLHRSILDATAPPPVLPSDALKVIEVIELAFESAKTQKPIQLV